jgi:FdhD protein
MLSCRVVRPNASTIPVELVRVDGPERRTMADSLAVERALEVRLHGQPFSVIMRTPGDDHALALGFLFSEGVVRQRDDLTGIEAVGDGDAVDVTLSNTRLPALAGLLGSRRNVTMNSSCGMCGRVSADSLDVTGMSLRHDWTVAPQVIAGLPAALRIEQHAFAETGGLHAAGLFDIQGTLVRSAEDVGRHNAVDKLIGHAVSSGNVPLHDRMLVVSGRLSFEIVQKAWLAGVPCVAAVSAPSSLAVDLAERAGMTLLGFVRDGRFNIYAGRERVE